MEIDPQLSILRGGATGELELSLESPAIARLIEEVRGAEFEVTRAYNRTYNRHNR
jgi:hypothetical protein